MKRLSSLLTLLCVSILVSASLTFDLQTIVGGVRINPSNNTDTYMWQLANEESMAGFGVSTPEAMWEAYAANPWFSPVYDLNAGMIELIYKDMDAMQEGPHTLVVAGCDEKGVRTSDFAKLDVIISLKDEGIVFDVRVTDIGKTSAHIWVSPSDDKQPYYFDYIEAAAVAQYATTEEFARDYVAYLRQAQGAALGQWLSIGADDYLFTEQDGLASGTSYYALAVAINMADTSYMPTIQLVAFQTKAQSFIEDFTFEFTYDYEGNTLAITPSYMDKPYLWQIYPDWEVDQKYGGDPERAWIENAPVAAKYAAPGVQTVRLTWECMWDGLYYLIVGGYHNGQTSPLTTYAITIEDGHMVTTTNNSATTKDNAIDRKFLQDGQLRICHRLGIFTALGNRAK